MSTKYNSLVILTHLLNKQMVEGYISLSLSTLVLNSRDWSEIVWLPEISRFKINLAIGFIRKKTHWNALVRL